MYIVNPRADTKNDCYKRGQYKVQCHIGKEHLNYLEPVKETEEEQSESGELGKCIPPGARRRERFRLGGSGC